MTGREFFDSNIILYAQIDDASLKHKQAVDLLSDRIVNGDAFVSVQVLNEFTVNVIKKGKKLSEAKAIVSQLLESFTVFPLTAEHNGRFSYIVPLSIFVLGQSYCGFSFRSAMRCVVYRRFAKRTDY